jgi:hypothetical protein
MAWKGIDSALIRRKCVHRAEVDSLFSPVIYRRGWPLADPKRPQVAPGFHCCSIRVTFSVENGMSYRRGDSRCRKPAQRHYPAR